ncbi:MAG: DUF131 domain-containing protein [Thermoplasmata archaeon]|nr:DUF131 domain-containing protein [Thermoplasmata archaeon]
MRFWRIPGPAVLLAGLVVLALAVARGEASLYVLVLFPVVVGSGPLGFLGIVLVFAGFALTFLLLPAAAGARSDGAISTLPLTSAPVATPRRRWGGVVFLGPIPIVFGSDSEVTRAMLLLGIVLVLALLALTVIAFLA